MALTRAFVRGRLWVRLRQLHAAERWDLRRGRGRVPVDDRAAAPMSEGRAASNGLDPANAACQTDATVDGRPVPPDQRQPVAIRRSGSRVTAIPQPARLSLLRDRGRDRTVIDPWRVDAPRYGLIDELREVGRTIGGSARGRLLDRGWLAFVDTWSARRGLLEPDALSGFSFQRDPLKPADLSSFAFIASRRRLVEAHAMCAQFQQHLGTCSWRRRIRPRARDRFLPIPSSVWHRAATQRAASRFPRGTFFFRPCAPARASGSNLSTPFIDVRLLGVSAGAGADACRPISTSKEFIWVYRPWQNAKALRDGAIVSADGRVRQRAAAEPRGRALRHGALRLQRLRRLLRRFVDQRPKEISRWPCIADNVQPGDVITAELFNRSSRS